jgi:hypothetical protein
MEAILMKRWTSFFAVIVIGAAIGLLIGWFLMPGQYLNTTPEMLRVDYQADYVLMVAEAFQKDDNLPLAVVRLAFLGGTEAQELVRQALLFAEPRYADADLALMRSLSLALQLSGAEAQP